MHAAQEGYNQLVIQPVLPKTRSQFTMSPCAPLRKACNGVEGFTTAVGECFFSRQPP
jgi:hypothetical protein